MANENLNDTTMMENTEATNTEAVANEATEKPAEVSEEPKKTFTQEELDRIINARFAKMQKEADARVAQAREEGKNEAVKLANMSDEEKRKDEFERLKAEVEEQAKEVKKREAEVSRRELRNEAVAALAKRQLPASFADLLNYTDAESCNKAINVLEKAYRDAVTAGVEEKIAKTAPDLLRRGNTPDEQTLTAQMRHAAGLK